MGLDSTLETSSDFPAVLPKKDGWLSWESVGRLRARLDGNFLVLSLLLVAVSLPRLRSNYLPRHDSLSFLELFHLIYSNVYFHGSIPEWIPYGYFGISIDHLGLNVLTPATYLAMYLGALLQIKDALVVFKLGLLLEQFTLLFGTYLLCRLLYRSQLATLVTCIGVICTADWTYQVHWNFRIYYLVPLGLYFLFRFFQSSRGAYFWLAGFVFVVALSGNVPYFPIPYFFFVILLCGLLSIGNWWILKKIMQPSPANLVCLLLFLATTVCYLYLLLHSLDSITVSAVGRSSGDLGTNLHTFLSHGGHPGASEFFGLLINGWPIYGMWAGYNDQSIYIGLLPLAMFVWALVRVRTRLFLALAIAAFAMLWLSLGGFFAACVYFLPGVRFFRHVGLLYAFAKILVLLCSGFGLEDFLKSARVRDLLLFCIAAIAACELFGAIHEASAIRNELAGRGGQLGPNLLVVRAALYVSVLLAGIWASFRLSRKAGLSRGWLDAPCALPSLGTLLLLAFFFDVGSFNLASYYYQFKPPGALTKEIFSIERPQYVEMRSDQPSSERARKGLQLIVDVADGRPTDYAYDLLQYVSCRTYFAGVLHAQGVAELLAAGRDRSPSNVILAADEQELKKAVEQKEQDHAFLKVVGCEAPRLRLVTKAVSVHTALEAEEAIRRIRDLDQVVVLRDRTGADVPIIPSTSNQPEDGKVTVLTFQPDQLEFDARVTSPGGAYLVYANSFHPDWRATVDGSNVKILEAYRAFQAIHLEPGNHRVKLAFRGQAFKPGRFLTLFSAMVGMIFFLGGVVLLFYTPTNSQAHA